MAILQNWPGVLCDLQRTNESPRRLALHDIINLMFLNLIRVVLSWSQTLGMSNFRPWVRDRGPKIRNNVYTESEKHLPRDKKVAEHLFMSGSGFCPGGESHGKPRWTFLITTTTQQVEIYLCKTNFLQQVCCYSHRTTWRWRLCCYCIWYRLKVRALKSSHNVVSLVWFILGGRGDKWAMTKTPHKKRNNQHRVGYAHIPTSAHPRNKLKK